MPYNVPTTTDIASVRAMPCVFTFYALLEGVFGAILRAVRTCFLAHNFRTC
jgi:hypothetical protein